VLETGYLRLSAQLCSMLTLSQASADSQKYPLVHTLLLHSRRQFSDVTYWRLEKERTKVVFRKRQVKREKDTRTGSEQRKGSSLELRASPASNI